MTKPTLPNPAARIELPPARPCLDVLADLRAEHDAGRLSTADFLSRIAVMQAEFICTPD